MNQNENQSQPEIHPNQLRIPCEIRGCELGIGHQMPHIVVNEMVPKGHAYLIDTDKIMEDLEKALDEMNFDDPPKFAISLLHFDG